MTDMRSILRGPLSAKKRFSACLILGIVGFILLFGTTSCSSIFTSSLAGTIIDSERYADGETVGIADARVFLYTEKDTCDADYAAFIQGDETTLPDAEGKASYEYFQSTVTDADGQYQFSGFIWHSLFPQYGKTADRREVYLLAYHPDYGLWKNPVPIFIVSDVTSRIPAIKIEDLWNKGRLSGTVLDWKNGKGLSGVSIRIYVPETWDYDSAGNPSSPVYESTPSLTVTSDADGKWQTDIQFAKKPDRASDRGKVPIRICFDMNNYRAIDPNAETTLVNAPMSGAVDVDLDGFTGAQGDWNDAYLSVTVTETTAALPLVSVPTITLQRYRFEATIRGRVYAMEGSPSAKVYKNGMEVASTLGNGSNAALTKSALTEQQTVNETTTDGHFALGTYTWYLSDIGDLSSPANGVTDEQKSGKIKAAITVDTNPADTTAGSAPSSGTIVSVDPDNTYNLDLKVGP